MWADYGYTTYIYTLQLGTVMYYPSWLPSGQLQGFSMFVQSVCDVLYDIFFYPDFKASPVSKHLIFKSQLPNIMKYDYNLGSFKKTDLK